jgi:hypothetical protein
MQYIKIASAIEHYTARNAYVSVRRLKALASDLPKAPDKKGEKWTNSNFVD